MSARLVILIVVAAALAVFFAVRKPAAPPSAAAVDDDALVESPEARADRELADIVNTPLHRRGPLPGEDPNPPPELDVKVEVDTSGGKNRLVLYISEKHGYYVEWFSIDFWHVANEAQRTDPKGTPFFTNYVLDRYLKANETLRDCIEIVDAELLRTKTKTIGTADDWAARISKYGRARAKNPDPLPIVNTVERCR
ncbi:MAG: hypothetical protein HY763_16045 [Planctomycetes bacterium]|nr:hypothetical protein [Planctomycetota bacterium]